MPYRFKTSSAFRAEDQVHGLGKLEPHADPVQQDFFPFCGNSVVASLLPVGLNLPLSLDQPVALQLMQGRIYGTLSEFKKTLTSMPDLLNQTVTVNAAGCVD